MYITNINRTNNKGRSKKEDAARKRRERAKKKDLIQREKESVESRRRGFNTYAMSRLPPLAQQLPYIQPKTKHDAVLSPPHIPIKSFAIKDVLGDYPQLKDPVRRVCDRLFNSDVQSDNGVIISMDGKMGNIGKTNMDYPSAVVHYYGAPTGRSSNMPGYKYRSAYATKSARGTKGICNTQLVNRLYDEDMKFIAHTLQRIVVSRHPYLLLDKTVNMNVQMNNMSPNIYADTSIDPPPKGRKSTSGNKDYVQMGKHNDISYVRRKGGTGWEYSKHNSQMKGTATITLSIGFKRTLYMTEEKVGNSSTPKTGMHNVVFELDNGDLFFLHSHDEEPKFNSKERKYLTKFMHGAIKFGGDESQMSICFAFRKATGELLCNEMTGHIWCSSEEKEECKGRDDMLKNKLDSTYLTKVKDKFQHLYRGILDHFKL